MSSSSMSLWGLFLVASNNFSSSESESIKDLDWAFLILRIRLLLTIPNAVFELVISSRTVGGEHELEGYMNRRSLVLNLITTVMSESEAGDLDKIVDFSSSCDVCGVNG
ncbi:hypothetical protein OGAPHI_003407 [Ogataea philodendri]|uniref:Uncharacterized protein n=1 Tax=Ogataea philodendri TaxID=1378263 RepID=A0A9P8P8W7_9ASCO|nr:uncharacterized protein OGAPHI_003407 [Ogataea philodendri]KAH3666957.1 hypothetical protein OGAPHI_003407 [Ogataea philodendri]